MMAGFDLRSVCAHCRDKKKVKDPCVEKPDYECQHCNVLTPEQLAQLSTPSYKLKKEKRDKSDTTPSKSSTSMTSSKVTQSHPCGPGTSVGNKGSGWPGHWFECKAGRKEEKGGGKEAVGQGKIFI